MNVKAAMLLVILAATASCSSSDSPGSSPGSAGAAGAPGSGGAAGAAQGGSAGTAGYEDAGPEASAGGSAGASGSDAAAEAGSAGPYQPCNDDAECQAGLVCDKPFNDLEYGHCTKACTSDAECPASPSSNPVGCHPDAKTCMSLCGVHGGTCPDGLVCTAQEFCLAPSTTTPTKGPGEHCTSSAECLDGAECVEGQYTNAYCAPKCQTDEDCSTAAPGSKGTCTDTGTFKFCMYMCGMMAGGAKCPGDMVCEGNAVCR